MDFSDWKRFLVSSDDLYNYVFSFDEATEIVRHYEIDSTSKFVCQSKTKDFGTVGM